jgi:multidrug efflux system membrane fusion protein
MRREIRNVALVGASLLATAACKPHETAAPERAPIPVKVETVRALGSDAVARYSGVIEPAAQVDMAFRVGGYVETLGQAPDAAGARRVLDKGDFVRKGSVLARIRSVDYTQRVLTSRAVIQEAESEARLAAADLERSTRLYESKAITKAEYDAKLARAEYAKANVEASRAREQEAAISLDDTVLRAPMDGVILARQVEVGGLVSPGQRAFTIADTKSVKVVFGAPHARVEQLALGTELTVQLEDDADLNARAPLYAHITRVAPSADSLGRVFAIEATLPNADGALRPGSVASVQLPDARENVATMLVPLSAVVRSPEHGHKFAVFVLEGNEHDEHAPARLSGVQLGEVLGNSVSVLSGLSNGQRVVTLGSTLLRDGSDAVVIR